VAHTYTNILIHALFSTNRLMKKDTVMLSEAKHLLFLIGNTQEADPSPAPAGSG
jgi:hypothetical protein